jgi:outer membrane protein TolC
VLDAQRTLWQAFQGYAHARFDLAIALTELERLVGKELKSPLSLENTSGQS